MQTTKTTKVALSGYSLRAMEYLRKYGPSGEYTSLNAPYGQPMVITNSNPFFGVYGNSQEAQDGYALALSQYNPRKRTNRAGEVFKY